MMDELQYCKRLSIQQLREFLLHGTELPETEPEDYELRLKNIHQKMNHFMDAKFPDVIKNEEIAEQIHEYGISLREMYFELGMKSGAGIAIQLLSNQKINL